MKSKIKIVYIISDVDRAIAFEWICDNINKDKFDLYFILLTPKISYLERYTREKGFYTKNIPFSGKKDYPSAIFNVMAELLKMKPKVIHCHLFNASLIGLFVGKLLRIKKRIYTRHHSSYNWDYNKKGIKYDKIINFLATDIIAISKNVKNVLIHREKVPERKTHLIYHGFLLESFKNVDNNTIFELKQKYSITGKTYPIIGVISRWFELKGIQYIIPAFKNLKKLFPDACLILANANGPFKDRIIEQLSELDENSYRIITFENDLFSLYKIFDIFIHTPVNPHIEAFGQTYIESLAAGIPSVFSLSGIAQEFIVHKKNAMVVDFCNSDQIENSIIELLNNRELYQSLSNQGKKDVLQFDLKYMIEKLEILYAR